MSSKLEKIYAVMPVSVQNLVVSVKGWAYNRKRYGKAFYKYFNWLMRSQQFSAEQFRHLQTSELRNLVKQACQNVPYYRKTLSKHLNSIDSLTLDNLKDIPMLEKSFLRANIDDFVDRERLKYGYSESHTSGTSGSPILVPYDFDSIQYDLAFRERQYRWAGITGKDKSARFGGRVFLGKHRTLPFWRRNVAENQWLFSTYHISDHTLPIYYKALKKYNLVYLDGYPSALFSVAKWINRNDKSGSWRPWAIFTTGETLTNYHRAEIEKAFACKVFNFYSSSEGAPFVTQCPVGNMHLNPESGIIEFLRPDGTDAELGEDAEMVVTSFFQCSMPLIRYRTGILRHWLKTKPVRVEDRCLL